MKAAYIEKFNLQIPVTPKQPGALQERNEDQDLNSNCSDEQKEDNALNQTMKTIDDDAENLDQEMNEEEKQMDEEMEPEVEEVVDDDPNLPIEMRLTEKQKAKFTLL